MKKVEIINLYKHNVVYKNIKNINIKRFAISLCVCVVTVFSFCYLNIVNTSVGQSVKTFNPISELYRDVEVASFVSSGSINFVVPIKTEKYKINSDNIEFNVLSSIVVYSPANGVVDEVGDVDQGVKYIKIKHADKLYSTIKNVNVVGVKRGDIVKQGKTIATAKEGDVVVFYIEKEGDIVNGLYLNKSFIKWD